MVGYKSHARELKEHAITHTHTHTHTHTRTHTHIYIYIHTHTHTENEERKKNERYHKNTKMTPLCTCSSTRH